jgi:hypothetical protein
MKVLSLPDKDRDWHGTAEQLAAKLNELLSRNGLDPEDDEASQRLVRYYVAEGVLSQPSPNGRERLFGFKQIVQYLVARVLLKQAWRLETVREFIQGSPEIEQLLAQLGTSAHEPTPAEKALGRIRARSGRTGSAPAGEDASGTRELTKSLGSTSSAVSYTVPTVLERELDVTRRRIKLIDDLKQLGNPSGEPERQTMVSIALTPWCQVLIETERLATLDSIARRVLGEALVSALEERRLKARETK